jgi:hypothetical protein
MPVDVAAQQGLVKGTRHRAQRPVAFLVHATEASKQPLHLRNRGCVERSARCARASCT